MIGTTGKALFRVGLVLAAAGLPLLADGAGWPRNVLERLRLGRVPGDVRFRGGDRPGVMGSSHPRREVAIVPRCELC